MNFSKNSKYIFYLFLIVTIITSLISIYLIFVHDKYPLVNINEYDRVGLAQYFIEFAGLIAILLAVMEFRKGQRRPQLDLWISQNDLDTYENNIELSHSMDKHIQSGSSIEFRFFLVIENYGDAIGRWVKISLSSDNIPNNLSFGFTRTTEEYNDFWNLDVGIQSHIFRFDGRDGFIIYAGSRQDGGYGELTQIGRFHIVVSSKSGQKLDPTTLTLTYSIQADGIDEKMGKIIFNYN